MIFLTTVNANLTTFYVGILNAAALKSFITFISVLGYIKLALNPQNSPN